MAKARRCETRQFAELRARRIRPGHNLARPHAVKGALVAEFARELNATHHRVEVAIGNEVYPGTFTLMLVNRLPEFDGLGGIFERGSNAWDVTIENVWR